MNASIKFSSYVPIAQRAALESLIFFNNRQQRVLQGIVNAIEKFGPPEIFNEGDRLRIRVDGVAEVQSLFAVESASGIPVGVAIYVRSDLERITILHLGIAEKFTFAGNLADEHLLLHLLAELRRLSRRIKGIRRLELFYLTEKVGEDEAVIPRQFPV